MIFTNFAYFANAKFLLTMHCLNVIDEAAPYIESIAILATSRYMTTLN